MILEDFELIVSDLPPNVPGLFFYGPEQRNFPFGSGVMCVGPGGFGFFRLNPFSFADGSGVARRALDFSSRPVGSGLGMVTSGSEWNFQYFYRDTVMGNQTVNLSSALTVLFCD